MPPTYPHPTPSTTLPFTDAVAVAAKVDKLPDPMRLAAHVDAWLAAAAPGVKATSLLDFSTNGSIMVLGNGGAIKDADVVEPDRISAVTKKLQKGRTIRGKLHGAGAQILNGQVPNQHVKAKFGALKVENEKAQAGLPKAVAKDPERLIFAGDESVIEYSQHPASGGSSSAQWDMRNRRILINAHVDDGSMVVHEYFHTFDVDGAGADTFGWYMDEGFTDFFARDVAARYKYPYKGNWAYENGYRAVKAIVDEIGLNRVCQLYFERDRSLLGLVQAPSQAIATAAYGMEAGELNPTALNVKGLIDDFNRAAKSWKGWHSPKWTVTVPDRPFRSLG